MKFPKGEKLLWQNGYLKYAITENNDCKICGADICVYWTLAFSPILIFSVCWIDLSEMMPTLIRFIERQRKDDDAVEITS